MFFPIPTTKNYARVISLPNVFSPPECDEIIRIGKQIKAEPAKVMVAPDKEEYQDIRKANLAWIQESKDLDWLFSKLYYSALQVNYDVFGFSLHSFGQVQFTEYEPGGKYEWHQDLGAGPISNRKLSQVIFLSDPSTFEGGKFELFEHAEIPQSRGAVAFFPSWEFHRANEVTKGVRYSLVNWINGTPFA